VTHAAEYRERLLPTWWVWLLAFALILMLAVAYGAALGSTAGLVVGSGGLVLASLLLWVTSPRVVVTPHDLRVADAVLPRTSVATAERVGPDEITALRGPGADARLFVSLRPWSSSEAVLVRLADPVDPHPAWLFSSRHPARVVAALTATMGR
jgi:hypothetical protein